MKKSKQFFSVSLWAALTVPFVCFALLITSLMSYVILSASSDSIREMTGRLHGQLNDRIESHVRAFLDVPEKIIISNANLIRQGFPPAGDQKALERFFLSQVRQETGITSLYFGNTSGGLADAGREGDGESLYTIETDGFQKGKFKKVSVDADGNPLLTVFAAEGFDARTRPWYTAAVEYGGPVWSEPYVLATGQDMAVSVSRPVFGGSGELQGVVSVDIFLSRINTFFSGLEISQNGLSFILDDAGYLISLSIPGSPCFVKNDEGKTRRLAAVESAEAPVREAAAILNRRDREAGSTGWKDGFDFVIGKEKYAMLISALDGRRNLNWRIVTVVPESDFLGPVYANMRTSILLILLAMICVLILGILVTRLLTVPISRLGNLAGELAQGKWIRVSGSHWIREVREINLVFNDLSGKIESMIGSLNSEIGERKKAEEILHESKQRMELALRGADLGTWDWNTVTGEMALNERWTRMLGYEPFEIVPDVSSWENLLHPEDAPRVREALDSHLKGETDFYVSEQRLRHKSGNWIWVLDMGQVIERDAGGNPLRVCGTHLDITERKRSEEQIQSLLREKEILIKEVHHRVKNNMMIINSLLFLQARSMKKGAATQALEDAGMRIASMMLLYDKLYRSEHVGEVSVRDYLSSLIDEIVSTYPKKVSLSKNVADISIPVKIASALGMIVNELISNAMKYAFPDTGDNKLGITVTVHDTHVRVLVEDNGKGFDRQNNPDGFGLELVGLLTEQLEGRFDIEINNGTHCGLEFDL